MTPSTLTTNKKKCYSCFRICTTVTMYHSSCSTLACLLPITHSRRQTNRTPEFKPGIILHNFLLYPSQVLPLTSNCSVLLCVMLASALVTPFLFLTILAASEPRAASMSSGSMSSNQISGLNRKRELISVFFIRCSAQLGLAIYPVSSKQPVQY